MTASKGFADGERDGQQVFGSVSAGYDHRDDRLLLSPYGRLEAAWSRLDSFSETGAGVYNLVFGKQDASMVAGVLGLRARYAIPMPWGMLTPRGRVEYTHDFSGSSRASMGYADLSNGLPYGFDVDAVSHDYVSLGLGFDALFPNGWTIGFDYGATLGLDGDSQDQTLAMRLSARF